MNRQSIYPYDNSLQPPEDARRRQLVDVTIDSLAEVGFVGTTLAQIAARAEVSPGLVAHYFDDKDGLLEAAFRSLARRVGSQVRTRLRQVSTARGRIQAIIDANLAPEEFDQRTGTAWLAFWGQVLHLPRLKRIQSAYQRRMLSNLRSSLKRLVAPDEAQRLAAMIAAMIDGVWLRAALSGWREADSESARALLTAFVDGRLGQTAPAVAPAAAAISAPPAAGAEFASINPATGQILGVVTSAGAPQINAAVLAAKRAQPGWAAMSGTARGRILHRAAEILRSRNRELAELETRDTGKPIQETSSGRRGFRGGLFRVLRGSCAKLERRASRSWDASLRLHQARAARGGRRDRRLELSAANRLLESCARTGLRQRHDIQACRADAVHRRQTG